MFPKRRLTSPVAGSDLLCKAFRSLSRSAWSLLRRRREAGVKINEETITNLVILGLQELGSPQLQVRSYSKREEAKTGADWEWWLGSTGQWVGFGSRQVIDFESDSFEHLYYTPKGVPQHERLLQSALFANPRRVPLYCLYTQWERPVPFRRSALGGCSLLSVGVVNSLARAKSKNLIDLYDYMTPWHQLVCPAKAKNATLPDRALAGSRGLREVKLAEPPRVRDGDETASFQSLMDAIEPTREIPVYVRTLQETDEVTIEDPTLQYVTVIEERPFEAPR
jgi:hypothetical protein